MTDQMQPAGNPRQVDVTRLQEVHYWTQRLDVSEEALRRAVADVGESADAVSQHLGRS